MTEATGCCIRIMDHGVLEESDRTHDIVIVAPHRLFFFVARAPARPSFLSRTCRFVFEIEAECHASFFGGICIANRTSLAPFRVQIPICVWAWDVVLADISRVCRSCTSSKFLSAHTFLESRACMFS